MTQANSQAMASLLTSEGFASSALTGALPDPLSVTPMVVTLDELRPYELNPRVRRNPLYDEIKSSILKRGLDSPPGITRRPEQNHYIIRDGGNTRLSILRELWSETRDERFFRIHCMFHPWTARGEIEAITGHLVENELRSALTFIERALAVQNVQRLYEELEPDQPDKPLSQSELSRRLKADGYPVTQPHISRMRETIAFILPALPNTLYAGLGRHQIEKLCGLRRVALRVWEAHRAQPSHEVDDFTLLFQEVLCEFDAGVESFELERIQDELTGRMADALELHYETVAAELYIFEAATLKPGQPGPQPLVEIAPPPVKDPPPNRAATRPQRADAIPDSPNDTKTGSLSARQDEATEALFPAAPGLGETAHVTERLQDLRERLSGAVPDDGATPAQPIGPAHVGGLYPSTDCWYIAPEHDTPRYLRTQIAQCAQEIVHEAQLHDAIVGQPRGIGFACSPAITEQGEVPAALALLHVLSAPYLPHPPDLDATSLIDALGPLLLGNPACVGRSHTNQTIALTDSGVITLLRLIRLARRLLESAPDDANEAPSSDFEG